ncbi:MAG: hypothetical protein ABIR56_11865, partial [Polaromonas sp.]
MKPFTNPLATKKPSSLSSHSSHSSHTVRAVFLMAACAFPLCANAQKSLKTAESTAPWPTRT